MWAIIGHRHMTAQELRKKFLDFFESRGHTVIPSASLVPENDSTTLFTSSGMQPLVPYLMGQEHPAGKRLVNSQLCFRADDIDEVGDNRHLTSFEMLGNWSLGDYFKKEQLPWFWEFLTDKEKGIGLRPEKLYVSIFEGDESVPKDTESKKIWKSLGIPDDHIFEYGVKKNWWSRSGPPEQMPAGEIGGPDSEVFYEFTQREHDKSFGKECHPNCDCGRFMEIGNSVFIQYQKQVDGSLKELEQKNVDFGGGLERLTAASNDNSDVFQTDLYTPIIRIIEQTINKTYGDNQESIRIIADHIKAAVFLIQDGIIPDNKMQGYVLRRLLRRVATKAFLIDQQKSDSKFFRLLVRSVINIYPEYFGEINTADIEEEVSQEIRRFRATLEKGLQRLDKSIKDNENLGLAVFNLFQSYGYPLELTIELLKERGIKFTDSDMGQFEEGKKSHIELSRTASAGMFKGGLADHSEQVVKGHTATHLLHQALRDVLGPTVHQTGSNITPERLRFDFSFERKLTQEEIEQVEAIVNEKIQENLPVRFAIMSLDEAKKMGAIGLFEEKYGDKVKVYFVGASPSTDCSGRPYSAEFCGGPHVEHTGVVGSVKIVKEEAVAKGIRRIRAQVSQ